MLTGQMWGVLIARRRAAPLHLGIREGSLEEVTQKWVEWQYVVCMIGEGGPRQEDVPIRGRSTT